MGGLESWKGMPLRWRNPGAAEGGAFYWNTLLSLFSWCGVVACVPVLATSLWEHGLHFTMCAPAAWYASGWSGIFVALFIFFKLFVDNYCLKPRGQKRRPTVQEVARSMSRKITQTVEAEADGLDDGASSEVAPEGSAMKKLK